MSAELTPIGDLPRCLILEIIGGLQSDDYQLQLQRLEKWWRRKNTRARARARKQRRGWS